MTSSTTDPSAEVVAPVRGALEFLLIRGAASFAVAALAVVITILAPQGDMHLLGHAALPGVLVFVVLARIVHVIVDRRPYEGSGAWARAAAIDHGETTLAATVAVVVPAAWLIGGAAILAHHAVDRSSLGTVLGVWAPIGGALWFGAALAWAGDCRERLARALAESDRRFRDYWAGLRPSD
jgi:hypothetical protein